MTSSSAAAAFLATDQVAAARGAKPVYAYLFAQAPIFSSDGSPLAGPSSPSRACRTPATASSCPTSSTPWPPPTPPSSRPPTPARPQNARRPGPASPTPSIRSRLGPLPRHLRRRRQQHQDAQHRQRRNRRTFGAGGPGRRVELRPCGQRNRRSRAASRRDEISSPWLRQQCLRSAFQQSHDTQRDLRHHTLRRSAGYLDSPHMPVNALDLIRQHRASDRQPWRQPPRTDSPSPGW